MNKLAASLVMVAALAAAPALACNDPAHLRAARDQARAAEAQAQALERQNRELRAQTKVMDQERRARH
ncbi:hypothetical protein [Microvirga arsenatis]|uniref:Uncharacterized protein n=1 Tax=Microvirga arsenatis TaxID=2692265 RepID=A0ABW9YZG2_9HYPH|nr:hypothetical protein [Microvirga arsenatis]NBJ09333.1 hypothetical protein [Microvirga arsenatis]NBJ23809.1 hypothetical protein [Microvirga arsenatis]